MAERHLVGGVELDRAAKGVVGLVHLALGGERLPQVVPGIGVLRGELGRAPQLLGRILGVELHTRAPGEHQQLDILGRVARPARAVSAGLAIFAGLELSACRLLGPVLIDPPHRTGLKLGVIAPRRVRVRHRSPAPRRVSSPRLVHAFDPGHTQLVSSGGSLPTSRTYRRCSASCSRYFAIAS